MEEFKWSSNLAYAVGLLTTDGNLSKDGRHLDLTSKDIEQLENFKKCIGLKIKISWKTSGYSGKKYPRIQFGNVKLYRWLLKIGLMPNKTKIINQIKVPDKYFFDFLRGHFDGDGCMYSYWDPRWKSSFMLYLQFLSASLNHIRWINDKVQALTNYKGRINKSSSVYQLRYAKNASKEIIKQMYHKGDIIFLTRKRNKIIRALKIEKEGLAGVA